MQPSLHRPRHATARLLAPIFLVLTLLVLTSLPGATRIAHAQGNILYVNDNAAGANNGSSWTNAYTDLQTALGIAQDGDEIWVAAGSYSPGVSALLSFQLENGVAIYGGFAGSEGSRTERDWIANVSILDGGQNSAHLVMGDGVDATAVLDGFTITGGFANTVDGGCPVQCGGGLYLEASSPTLANLIITDNHAKWGAGMLNNHGSNPTLTNVAFLTNTITLADGWGGAMYNYQSSPTLTDVLFRGNEAIYGNGNGGAIANIQSSPLIQSGVLFNGNRAFEGGALYNYDNSNPSILDVVFSNNRAFYAGGGISNYNSNPSIQDVIFSGNQAGADGGVIYNLNSSPSLINVTFSGNWAANGGGALFNNNSFPTLTNVILSGNQAEGGGALYNYNSGPSLTNVILSGNRATGSGGAIYDSSSNPLIQNSILWGNSAPDSDNIDQNGGLPSIRYSVIEGGVPPGITDDGHNLTGDPRFVRAVNCGADGCGNNPDLPGNESANDDYGDLRLQPTSPAIDVGDNAADLNGTFPGDATIATIDVDPDGAPRLAAVKQSPAIVDLGAYERINTVSAQAGGPYTANEGGTIALNGSASSDEAGITGYAWDCTNNGSVEATSASPTGNSCTYPDDGAFTLKLTATDVIGLAGSATAAVTIANVLPTLTDPPNQSTNAATATGFMLGSFADPGADAPWQVVVNWGDNSATSQFSAATVGALPDTSHTFAQAGTYNVVVTINDGGGNGSGGFQVVVNAAAPGTPTVTAAAAQSASAGEAQSYALGSFSDAGDAGPWQVTVNWGDGSAETLFNTTSSGALPNQSHTYAAAGTYTVLVTVSDGDLASSASFQVTIEGEGEPVDEGGGLYLPNITR